MGYLSFLPKSSSPLKVLLMAGALAPVAIVAYAEVYLSPEQAVQAIYGRGSEASPFERREILLTKEQVASIEKATGQTVRNSKLVAFVDKNKNAVLIDQVLGKHELITFAVGVNADGTVRGIEILEYRETYGQQVKNADWRKQFIGLKKSAPIKIGADIKNISGATLSSAHVTAGVKRLLETYDRIRESL
jgi:Na+-translocating ferredoxin:NAD+ oxidoreductase RnfG subunit